MYDPQKNWQSVFVMNVCTCPPLHVFVLLIFSFSGNGCELVAAKYIGHCSEAALGAVSVVPFCFSPIYTA